MVGLGTIAPALDLLGLGFGSTVNSTAGSTRGLKNAWAIIVGTTALPITTVTRIEYWHWLIYSLFSPNKALIVPNVRPVDISSVV